MDVVVSVDFDKRMVDGGPAVFTDHQIRWDRARMRNGKVEFEQHSINRLSGSYVWFTKGVFYPGPPPLFTCEKAPAAKF